MFPKQNSLNKNNNSVFETEIIINKKTGEVYLNRDHEVMVSVAKALNPNDDSFEDFFNSKPENIEGEQNYNSFCG